MPVHAQITGLNPENTIVNKVEKILALVELYFSGDRQ